MSEANETSIVEKHPHRVGVVAGRFFPGSRRGILRPPGPYVVERAVAEDRTELVRMAASGSEVRVELLRVAVETPAERIPVMRELLKAPADIAALAGRLLAAPAHLVSCARDALSRRGRGRTPGSKYAAAIKEINEMVARGSPLRQAMKEVARRDISEANRLSCGVAVEPSEGAVDNRVRYFRRLRRSVGGIK